jgi:outer membrane protein OmpA-like peptidoglycan-associated protein
MRKIATLIFAIILITNNISGQIYKNKIDSLWTAFKIKQGEKVYNNMRYLKTTEIYSPIFYKGALNNQAKSILAQSYLNIAESEKAEEVLVSMEEASMSASDVYNMAQCLKLNAAYDESDIWMAKFEKMSSADSRPKWQSNSASEVAKILNRNRYNITPMPFNSAQSDFGAFPYGQDIVFASARKIKTVVAHEYGWKDTPYLNVFKVSGFPSGNAQPEIFSSKVKTVYHDGPVSFSADGTEMFVSQNPYKLTETLGKKEINQFRLLMSKLQPDSTWGPLVELPFNGAGFSTGHGALSPDGTRLWFASDRPGGYGRSDIYYVNRSGEAWDEPVNAGPQINTEGDEMFPFEATDGKVYFSSNGHLTIGGLDICIAFKTPGGYEVRNMGYPINSAKDDFGLYMASDNKSGYFASNRPGGMGDDDIYSFKILDPVILKREFSLVVKDKTSGDLMINTEVIIISGSSEVKLRTNKLGIVNHQTDGIDELTVTSQPTGYYPKKQEFTLSQDVTQAELLLEPLPVWGVYGQITDLNKKMGVDSVQVLILPTNGSAAINNITLDGGRFRNQIEPETDYTIVLNHPQYFTKRGSFTTKGRPAGWINVNEFLQTEIEKVEINAVIEIPNIYYDLGKWNIRKDAAVELDKVVVFLNDNPAISIELGSHTDSRGNPTSNQSLSQKRAQSAVDYIVKKGGVAKERIIAKGYGESMLKNHCADGVTCSESEHQENRRTEIRITGVE